MDLRRWETYYLTKKSDLRRLCDSVLRFREHRAMFDEMIAVFGKSLIKP